MEGLKFSQLIGGVLPDFPYQLSSNILMSSEGITILQNPLFLNTFLRDSSLFFVLNK